MYAVPTAKQKTCKDYKSVRFSTQETQPEINYFI